MFVFVARLAGSTAGGLAGLLTAGTLGLLRINNMVWSEAPFIASMTAMLALLQSARYSGRPWRWRLAASGMAAANVGIRFAGVGFLPVLLWEALLVGRRFGWRRGLLAAVNLLALPTAVLGGLWGRNYILTGTIRGMPASNVQHGVFATLRSIITHILPEAGLTGALQIGGIALTLLPVVLWIIHRRRSAAPGAKGPSLSPAILPRGLDLPVIALAGYAVSLAVAVARYQPKLEMRFVTPLAPLATIIATTVLCTSWKLLRDSLTGRPARIARWGYVLSLVVLLLLVAHGPWKHFQPARIKGSVADTRMLAWMRKNVPAHAPVATNIPAGLAFYAGYTSMYLPNCDFDPGAAVSSSARDWLSPFLARVGVDYAAFLCDPNGLKPELWGKLVADLSCGKTVGHGLVLVYRGPDGIVYKRRQPTTAPAMARQ